jgi:hypothetical protein
MPASTSDFCSRVNSAAPVSGARFAAVLNSDGTVSIFRRATPATADLTLIYPRVVYSLSNDSVSIGDGSSMRVQDALAFVAALN